MNLNLKQTEIVAALRQYVAQQGINLIGKEVTMSFTAGRKEAGISVDIGIEEIDDFPDLVGNAVDPIAVLKADLKLVPTLVLDEAPAPIETQPEPAPAPEEIQAEVRPAVSATTSLFN